MNKRNDELRQLVAEEAARLIYEEGLRDYRIAKLHAANQLGVHLQPAAQPSNAQIEAAIFQRIRLFDAETHPLLLKNRREIALEAMEFLKVYHPYLVGSVLEGTASIHSPITLLLATDSVEEVMFFLEDNNIPFENAECRLRFGSKQAEYFPVLNFWADDVEIELLALPYEGKYMNSPISPITGKAMKRADIKKLSALLAT